MGTLAAIAIPGLVNQAAKAKEAEAKQYVGTVNRSQQAYRIERTEFASSLGDLELGIPAQTSDYNYQVKGATQAGADFGASSRDSTTLRSYTGAVRISNGIESSASCSTASPSSTPPTVAIGQDSIVACQPPAVSAR